MGDERAPTELREGVRAGILAAVERDAELRGARTARLLAAAGALGAFGAIGITLLLGEHPYGHHPAWHGVVFAAIWSGLLVVSLALAFLGVRTPSLPLAAAARVGLLGLGLAGLCGAACPDQHFLHWWSATSVGGFACRAGGLAFGALCLGLLAALAFGAVAAFVSLSAAQPAARRPLLPAAMLLLLLAPGIALQSVGDSFAVFASWLSGTAAGAYAGVSLGIHARSLRAGRAGS